jgi:hypothetical protein
MICCQRLQLMVTSALPDTRSCRNLKRTTPECVLDHNIVSSHSIDCLLLRYVVRNDVSVTVALSDLGYTSTFRQLGWESTTLAAYSRQQSIHFLLTVSDKTRRETRTTRSPSGTFDTSRGPIKSLTCHLVV